jgi:hypothetical protein
MTRPQLEVAEVFRQHGDAFLERYGDVLSSEQRRALKDIAVCRTAALGGHVETCDQCGHQRVAYNSSVDADPSNNRAVVTSPRAGRIRYVLIPFDSGETNRLSTDVETTSREVTVDSLSFTSKNELATVWATVRRRCEGYTRVNIRGVATTVPLRIAAKLPLQNAAASIQSP